ncbi:hypothetical protein DVS28_a4447 [Euzebya pacifica]|uniref:Uncharacterized protein n=1 Tax=Euzebya pacifica TaxID=1608957 RepID=A0A346Y3R5_9ACTN|nr:hypothetical protein DVS28_a4447 [Euzebya pacifica]
MARSRFGPDGRGARHHLHRGRTDHPRAKAHQASSAHGCAAVEHVRHSSFVTARGREEGLTPCRTLRRGRGQLLRDLSHHPTFLVQRQESREAAANYNK